MEKHSGDTPHKFRYKCKTCGKGLKRGYYLTKHLRVHIGERLHKCSMCDNMFSYRSNLNVHMVTHSEETPHKCKTFGK